MTGDGDPTVRAYGAAIALVSGGYSLLSATTGVGMGTGMAMGSGMGTGEGMATLGGGVMVLLGLLVVGHGIALLTPLAGRLGNASGPLMIGYSIVMVLNQALVGTSLLGGMDMNDGMAGSTTGESAMSGGMAAGTGWDAGMVALAILMLVSGVLMTHSKASM